MKQAVVTIKYDEEKLNAVKQYMGKKDAYRWHKGKVSGVR